MEQQDQPDNLNGKKKPSATEATLPNNEQQTVQEIGGAKGPEPTRFGDWEKNGRCIDF